ncbi:tetraspanin-7-like [Corythoichthys intestinalis]|uniref:tetraspanin-7-like n=1 Tax=Corythoichthys intestinalis TaxID=161448 RepID=UPI0025A4EE7C|nr:tetraspanin-7-like [Corythoichthys intestinalis]XP_061809263.1 tetraspanin-7-like [Nerophis lumbriciformis]
MSSPLQSFSVRPSPSRHAADRDCEQLAVRRLSSPRSLNLLTPPPYPRRASAIPGYLLPPHQEQEDYLFLQQQQCRRLSLPPETLRVPPAPAPAVPAAAAPCRRSVGIMHLLRLGLLTFSCLFWAAGLALFTLGVWAQISLADFMLLSSNRYPNAPVILLTTGAAVTIWGFLGCLGVAANLPYVLRAYGFFQLAALVAGLAGGLCGLFYREDIAGGFRSGLQRAVAGYAEDEGRADALDGLQRALRCCGAEGWRDWLTSDWALQHTNVLTVENGTLGSLPDSCCMRRKGCRNRPLPSEDNEGVVAAGIHPHGCFRKVFSLVNDNVFHIAATVLGLAFTQIGGITLACLLANRLAPRQRAVGN